MSTIAATDPRRGKRTYQSQVSPQPAKIPEKANLPEVCQKNTAPEATQGPISIDPIPQHGGKQAPTTSGTGAQIVSVNPPVDNTTPTPKPKQDQVTKPTPPAIADLTRVSITSRPSNLSDKHNNMLIDSLFASDNVVLLRHGYRPGTSYLSQIRKKHPQYWSCLVDSRNRIPAAMALSAQYDGTALIEDYLTKSRTGKNPIESVKDASFMASLVTQVAKIARDIPDQPDTPDQDKQKTIEATVDVLFSDL